MKRKVKSNSSLYKYLEPYLVIGDEQTIAQARKEYMRLYKATWRKEKRRREKEITTSWRPDELKELQREAKRHKSPLATFVKKCTIAYLDKRYIVPHEKEVRQISQMLAMQYNSIQEMIEEEMIGSELGRILLSKLEGLEREMLIRLYSPDTIEMLLKKIVKGKPEQKENLIKLLATL